MQEAPILKESWPDSIAKEVNIPIAFQLIYARSLNLQKHLAGLFHITSISWVFRNIADKTVVFTSPLIFR